MTDTAQFKNTAEKKEERVVRRTWAELENPAKKYSGFQFGWSGKATLRGLSTRGSANRS
jgi:hypothetical protein